MADVQYNYIARAQTLEEPTSSLYNTDTGFYTRNHYCPARQDTFYTYFPVVFEMKGFCSLVYSLGVLQTFAAGTRIPKQFRPHPTTPIDLNTTEVQRELGYQVSSTTAIFGPSDGRFDIATSRWTIYGKPQIQVVIEPGQESDVSTIVGAMHKYS